MPSDSTVNVAVPPLEGKSKYVCDAVAYVGQSTTAPDCMTFTDAVFPPLVTIIVPDLDASVFLIMVTVTVVFPEAPEVSEIVAQSGTPLIAQSAVDSIMIDDEPPALPNDIDDGVTVNVVSQAGWFTVMYFIVPSSK